MSKKTSRTLLSVLAIGSALVMLLVVTMRGDALYTKNVNDVMPAAEQWYGKNLQLHGYVVLGSIERKPNTLEYRFNVKEGDQVVRASYTGVLPDQFKDRAEVIMKGRLTPTGFQVQDGGIMAKCPSKYDPAGSNKSLAAQEQKPAAGAEY
jgi:cytochrome c-type biogenesis protein CcmE